MIQLPEPSGHADLKTIADVGKERIRRVIKKLKDEANGQQALCKDRATPEDLGEAELLKNLQNVQHRSGIHR